MQRAPVLGNIHRVSTVRTAARCEQAYLGVACCKLARARAKGEIPPAHPHIINSPVEGTPALLDPCRLRRPYLERQGIR